MAARDFVDTNVFLYLFDPDAPGKRTIAEGIVRGRTADRDLVVSTQVMQEFFSIASGKFADVLSPGEAESALAMMRTLEVVVVQPEMVQAAASRSRRDRLNFWDALIVESALVARCTRLLSEDFQNGRQFDGLRVENPFRT